MEEITEEMIKEHILDLKKYVEKLNMMMLVSTEGVSPQVFKLILGKKLFDYGTDVKKKQMGIKKFEQAEKIVDEFLNQFGGKFNTLEKEEEIKDWKKLKGY